MNRPPLPGLAFLAVLPFCFAAASPVRADDPDEDDEALLQKANVRSDRDSLLEFLRRRSLTEARRQELEKYIQDLGSRRFSQRQRATQALIAQGAPALPFLRRALRHPDVEVVRRASQCIEKISRGPGPDLVAAAVRLVGRCRPARSAETLLLYLPYADNEAVAEEVLCSLVLVSRRDGKLDPALTAALGDRVPARRGAAAYVLGRTGDADQRAQVRKLLADADPQVRFQAAYGLAAGKDRQAVPVLIALVKDGPDALAWQAEDLLSRIAGDRAPPLTLGGGDKAARRKAAAAWEAWWRQQGPRIDWDQIELGQPGGAVVAELESNTVWEAGPGGKPRWEVDELQSPYDVEVLTNGRLLVAEYTGQRVTERGRDGKVHWEKPIDSPVACRRGPGGATFIATTRGVVEVNPQGKEVHAFTLPQGDQPLYGACRVWGSDTAYIGCAGGLFRVDFGPRQAAKRLPVEGQVTDVQALPNGHLLVTTAVFKVGKVLEVDAAGKTVWEAKVPRATSATRLANGNTLVTSMVNRRLVQVDAAGKVVWQKATAGRPVRVHRR
jgi:hypothetical protein